MSVQSGDENLSVIYKYRDLPNDNTINIIKNSAIFFNDPSNFNDPFDSHVDYDLSGNNTEWKTYLLRNGFSEELAEEYSKKIEHGKIDTEKIKLREYLSMIRVSCFCRSNNNILLWSHYAKNHEGICLGFNVYPEFNSNCMHFNNNDLLKYSDGISEGILPLTKVNYEFNKLNPFNPLRDDTERITDFIYQKYKLWEYEEEYRIAHLAIKVLQNPVHFDPHELTEIIFGIKTSEDNKQKVIEAVSGLPAKGNWIRFYQAIRSNKKYGVDINLI